MFCEPRTTNITHRKCVKPDLSEPVGEGRIQVTNTRLASLGAGRLRSDRFWRLCRLTAQSLLTHEGESVCRLSRKVIEQEEIPSVSPIGDRMPFSHYHRAYWYIRPELKLHWFATRRMAGKDIELICPLMATRGRQIGSLCTAALPQKLPYTATPVYGSS